MTVKVSDFGTAKLMSASQTKLSITGTVRYSAPETTYGEEETVDWRKADVYSFGITMYETFTGKDAVAKKYASVHGEIRAIAEGVRPPLPYELNNELQALIKQAWDGNPNSRPTMMGILLTLERIRVNL